MELLYKKENASTFGSISINRVLEPVFERKWHFHPEYELIYIINGIGVRLVGDNLSNFHSGELVLVGPNLPHLWRSTGNQLDVDRIVIKFSEMPGNVNLFSIPEFSLIKALLAKSATGISFGPATEHKVKEYFFRLTSAENAYKWIWLINILEILSRSSDIKTLSNPIMKISPHELEENRLLKVISYISDNYDKNISLSEAAEIAFMTTQSFCRFFKKRTNKTFVQFLNEYKIGKACVLLIENQLPVTEICYSLGFNSITNFNRVFKKLFQLTPVEYKKLYSKALTKQ